MIKERKTWRIKITKKINSENESTPSHSWLIYPAVCKTPATLQSSARTESPIILSTGYNAGTILNPTDFSLTEDIVSP